ncbi:HAMP domain-containing protein [Tepidanaerobacter sp. GT38]|uniref:HAMP domain-containing protein n=1 Tax=Tepidanaerobacter sp. GT38 TaxID=2722793 RepID=UPI001F031829|nr:HAMP domain-containing protein [Tepidanaerobacter sp. GT38]MCG1011531.1 HAMP domain-containing protein [Tepidanaerobacter sp. GT38]
MARVLKIDKGFSLTFRLSLAFTLLIIFLMGSVAFLFFIKDRNIMTQNVIERGWTSINSINPVARDSLKFHRLDVLDEFLGNMRTDGFIIEAIVRDLEGKPVEYSGPRDLAERILPRNTYVKAEEKKLSSIRNEKGEITAFVFSSPVLDELGTTVGYMQILVDFKPTVEHLQKSMRSLIYLFVATVVIGLVAARLIVEKFVAKPVKDIMSATEKVSIGDFSQRLDLERNDEMGRLAQSFNIMSDQLGVLFASIKDAVTEMSASSKLIVHRTEEIDQMDPTVQKEFIKEIKHNAKMLNRISLQLDSLVSQFKTKLAQE